MIDVISNVDCSDLGFTTYLVNFGDRALVFMTIMNDNGRATVMHGSLNDNEKRTFEREMKDITGVGEICWRKLNKDIDIGLLN